MQVCVLGAGSLGSVIGGMLARSGHTVTLVSRNAAHVDAVRQSGLTLVDDRGSANVQVAAVTSTDGLPPPDLLVVLVKSFDTHAAMEDAAHLAGGDTLILTLQNGVGCEDIIADVVGRDRLLAGRTFVGGRMIGPGVIEYGVEGRTTVLGELDGRRSDRLLALADTFDASGMVVEISTDIVAMMWEKLFVNVATGAWSALTGLPYGELSIHPDIERMAIATVAEAMDVARALGIDVATSDPRIPWRRAWEGLPYGFKASMLQSVEKGARTEVDVMHGAVAAGGRRAGVPTPINDALVAAVHGIERRLQLAARIQRHRAMELIIDDDGRARCSWGASTPDYARYHDTEWGFGVTSNERLFEKICLEGFQSGLSWLTILRKRENFRSAFAGFDPDRVAAFDDRDVERLLGDAGIVRHRGKIRSTINNAHRALELIDEYGSLAAYLWPAADFVSGPPLEIPAITEVSTQLSRQLKRLGWSFVGPTTMYAFMQAMGLVNDHLAGCWVRDRAEVSRREAAASIGLGPA